MKRLFKYGLVLLAVLAAAHNAYAAVMAVTVSPVTRSIAIPRGGERRVVFTAYNKSDKTKEVLVVPRLWFVLDENKDMLLDSWLDISPSEFTIGPMEKKEVTAKITVPEDAEGELSAMIAFRPKPEEGQSINIVFSVSLYVMVLGTEEIDYKISNFKLWKFEDRDSVGAIVQLKNDGNIHLKPKIKVTIQSIFKKRYIRAIDLEYGEPAYPKKDQIYKGAMHGFKLKPGLYRAVIDMDIINLAEKSKRNAYFLVGWKGKILYTFFKRP